MSFPLAPGGSGNDTPQFVLTNKSDSLEIKRLVFTVGAGITT